jgi:hypothetical protein
MHNKNVLFLLIFTATALGATPLAQQNHAYLPATATKPLSDFFGTITTLLQNTQNPTSVAQFLNDSLGTIFALIAETSDKNGAELDRFMDDIKNICKLDLIERMATAEKDADNEEYRRPSKPEKDPAATQAILYNVANVVSGVVTIAQSPHDKENVKQSISAILCGIIGIAVNASHRSITHPLLHCYIALATAHNLA